MKQARARKPKAEATEAPPPPVLRCDPLPHGMNRGKEAAVRRTLLRWRRAAGTELAVQWRAFLDGAGDLAHARRAGRLGQDQAARDQPVGEAERRAGDHQNVEDPIDSGHALPFPPA